MPTTDQRDTLVIHDLVSLRAWRRRLWNPFSRVRVPIIELRLPALTSAQNRHFSLLAAGFQRMCGCASGGLVMTIAVGTMIGYFVTHHHLADVDLRHLVILVGSAVLAALVGKLAGLLWARQRLLAVVALVITYHASILARQPITAGST